MQSTTVYDELCSPPDKSIEETPLSDDKELIRINDGHTDVVLVDPALKLIADQLDSEFEDEKADREGQDAAQRLFLVLCGDNIRKVLKGNDLNQKGSALPRRFDSNH